MSAHAQFSPSSAARWLACPPSARLSAGLPERTSVAAEKGTAQHAVLERHLRAGTMPVPVQSWVIRDDNAMTDYEVVGYARAFIQNLGGGRLLYEHKVVLMSGVWGTLDVGHLSDIITIFDFKRGGWDVTARDNKQLLTYAGTFLKSHPHVQHFRLVIFQPNSWGKDEIFDQAIHTRADVEQHVAEVAAALAYAGPPKPGPKCRWCPAFSQCPAMSEDAAFVVGAMSRVDLLTAAELTRMLRLVRNLSDMKDHMEERLTALLKAIPDPKDYPDGTTLKQSRKWRAFNDTKHAAETLYRLYGAKGVKPVGVAEAERLGPEGKAYVATATHKPEGEFRATY